MFEKLLNGGLWSHEFAELFLSGHSMQLFQVNATFSALNVLFVLNYEAFKYPFNCQKMGQGVILFVWSFLIKLSWNILIGEDDLFVLTFFPLKHKGIWNAWHNNNVPTYQQIKNPKKFFRENRKIGKKLTKNGLGKYVYKFWNWEIPSFVNFLSDIFSSGCCLKTLTVLFENIKKIIPL